jgi:hypothetical protein
VSLEFVDRDAELAELDRAAKRGGLFVVADGTLKRDLVAR